jgi:saccharopine dehydrogenase-like NADP-dependent oxidoreductase
MRIAVIGGAGGMGRVTTADAATSDGVERVILVDRDAGGAAEIAAAHANVEGGAPEDPGALERLRAHVVGTRSGERVEIDADLALTQRAEWGTDSGTYSTGVPPSVTAQLLAGGQALRTRVGGPEAIVPVRPFFAALARRGMHAEMAVHRPLG